MPIGIQLLYTSYHRLFFSGGLSSILGQFAANYDSYKGSALVPGFIDLRTELKKTKDVRQYVTKYTETLANTFGFNLYSVIIDDYAGEYLVGIHYSKNKDKTLHSMITVPSRCSHSCVLRSMLDVAGTMVDVY